MAVVTPNGLVRPTISDPPVISDLDPNWGFLETLLDTSLRTVRVHALSTVNVSVMKGPNPVIDGSIIPADRTVMLTAQTIRSQNGPWTIALGANDAWTRPPSFVSGTNAAYRLAVVGGGNTYMGSVWLLGNPYAPVVDRDAQNWQMLGSALIPLPQNVTTSGTSAAYTFEPVDTTLGTITRTLPTAPPDGTRVEYKQVIQGTGNSVSIACGGTDVINKPGGGTTYPLPMLNQAVMFQYQASTGIWFVFNDNFSLSQLDLRFAPFATSLRVQQTVNTQPSVSSSYTLPDVVTATVHKLTLTGNVSLTMPAAGAGKIISVSIAQDAAGSRIITWPRVIWPGNTAPVLSTAPYLIDEFVFFCQDGLSWEGVTRGLGYSPVTFANESMAIAPTTGTAIASAGAGVWNASGYWVCNSASNTYGNYEFTNAISADFVATWDAQISSTSGADAMWFYFGCSATPTVETTAGYGGYAVVRNELNGKFRLYFNGTLLQETSWSPKDANWDTLQVTKVGNAFTLTNNGVSVLTFTDSTRTLPGSKYGFGGRSGSTANTHRIRNLLLTSIPVTTTPSSPSSALSVVSKSSSYAVTSSDDVIKGTTSGIVLTLPDAITATKKRYTLKNFSSGNISFATTSSQTVDGSTTGTIIPNQALEVVPDGANWNVT